MQPLPAAAEYAQHVADRGALLGGDNADFFRIFRERFFLGFVEEAFALQFFLQLLEGQLESAFRPRLHVVDDDLIPSVRRIDRRPSPDQNLQSVLGLEL